MIGTERTTVSGYDRKDETASPGYYSVILKPAGIKAELTSTARTGFHRYTYPAGEKSIMLIDAGSVIQPPLWTQDHNGCPPSSIGGYVEKISETEIVGRGDYKGGWGHTYPYSVFFYARTGKPIRSCNAKTATGFTSRSRADGSGSSIVLNFGKEKCVELQVGISYVSVAKARASVDREIGKCSFEEIRKSAENEWEQMLSRIQVEGGTAEQRRIFYTLFTRLVCMPSDLGIDDEFGQWNSGKRHFTDFYCLWDSVRNANSLLTLLAPEIEVDQLNCLLDVADKTGWLPDAWIAGHSAHAQGGSSADILICEAALKGLKGIDYGKALLQMRKNNEVMSPDPYMVGRYLEDYSKLGYLSTNVRLNCVSRTLEYAYQDWCIGRLAEHVGQKDVAKRYYKSSKNCWNLWKDDIRQFAPKRPDGQWAEPFDPAHMLLPDCWNDPYFYEGKSWQWSFNVQHDFAELVKHHGGSEGFIAHLDTFFEKKLYYSKETMLHIPCLYHYAGRPDKSVERVRWAMKEFFSTKRNGLADNEDMGCQSAFYMCSAMGLYPLMGQDIYWLIAPIFEKIDIRLNDKNSLRIETEFETPGAIYITSAELNGKPLDRAWLRHGEIAKGGILKYRVSVKPGNWGVKVTPPSK
jgi:predicted alpha-1,2-mannosidase